MINPSNIPENIKKYLPGDFQTNNKFEQSQNNYLLPNRFIFVINRCPTVSFYLQRVNLPTISLGITPQANPTGIDIRRPGNKFIIEDIQISFPVDENMKNYLEIFTWMKSIAPWSDGVQRTDMNKMTSDATLFVLNSSYNHIMTYKYYNLFPSFLSGLDFDVTLPDLEPMIASAVFTFDYFDIIENFTV
jgi:hypothetical protein